jgi:hypothetical protein
VLCVWLGDAPLTGRSDGEWLILSNSKDTDTKVRGGAALE